MAKNIQRPVTARSLIGAQRPVSHIASSAAMKAKRERLYTQQQLTKIPPELADEKPESIGQAVLPDGKRMYIVYDEEKKAKKIIEIDKDGNKVFKQIGADGRVTSIQKEGTELLVEYISSKNDETQVVLKDKDGNVVEKRLYSEKGILLRREDSAGDVMSYQYTFDKGQPVTYSLLSSDGTEIETGDVSRVADLQLRDLVIQPSSTTTSYNYEYNNDGTVWRIIENQGKENEVIRELDRDRRLISLKKKKTGATYTYKYDKNGDIKEITIVDKDGNIQVIDRDNRDFNILTSEADIFDPLSLSEMVQLHKNYMQYMDKNLLQKKIDKSVYYKNLPTARELKGPVQPADVIKASPAPVRQPVAPSVQKKSYQPSATPSIPKRY
jgi:YD repeat-containing protein